MLKSFEELSKIDVTPHCDMRDAKDDNGKTIKVPYLNWVKCKMLLHENGANKVTFEPVVGANGSSLIMSDTEFVDKNGVANRCYEVRVRVTIDDLVFDWQAPLMNGSNPVKDNSMTQQRLWNAQTRAFVKGVAIHTGLGIHLWVDDEDDKVAPEDDLYSHKLTSIQKRMEERLSSLMARGMTVDEIAKAIGWTRKQLDTVMTVYFRGIAALENGINGIYDKIR